MMRLARLMVTEAAARGAGSGFLVLCFGGELVRQFLCRLEVECTFVHRAAGDDAHHAFLLHGAQRAHVVQVVESTAGDDGNAQLLCQRNGRLDIDAGEHAVAADIGIENGLDAVVLEFLRQVDHGVPGHFRPAFDRHLAVLGIEGDDDVSVEGGTGVLQEAGILHCGGADHDVAHTAVDVALDRVEIANAAAQLDRQVFADFIDDLPDDGFVLRLAGNRAVEVDDMQPSRAQFEPVTGHANRVFGKNGGVIHVALLEADTAAVFEIDCRNNNHRASAVRVGGKESWNSRKRRVRSQGFQDTKFDSNCSPAAWLFSGWNWTAKMLSRATAQVKGNAYSVLPVTSSVTSGTT